MSKLRDSIMLVLLAGLVVGCQKGGDAVDETTQKAPSTPPSTQSAGVSNQGSSESDEPEENLSKEEFAEARLKMECAIEKLGSDAQPSDIRSRVLEVMGVSESAYERAETRYGDEEELGAGIRKRMSTWCTDKRVRRALEMDGGSE